MNIIFISNSMAKAKTLSVFQVSAIVLALLVLPVLLTLILIVPQDTPAQQGGNASKLRFSFNIGDPQKHLDAYAVQMGELQARIMRLDAQSERLAKLAGEKKSAAPLTKSNAPSLNAPSPNAPSPNAPVSKPSAANRGGPLVLSSPYTEMDLQKHIAELTARVEFETEYLSELEATLLQQSMLKGVLPNRSPIRAAFNSSSYGWRIDPFNGNKAFHEGLDFSANAGAPIFAAAGGIAAAMRAALALQAGVSIQIEVENLAELEQALSAGAKSVFLDNFTLDLMREAVRLTAGKAVLEASGGINRDTVRAFAETGVDRISIGSLTKDVRATDYSLRVLTA